MASMAYQPRTAQRVRTLSGRGLGYVRAVRAGSFLLQRDDDGMMWLSIDAVYLGDGNDLTLICELEGLTSYRLDRPA
jgi:hypothetical protein